MKTQISPTEELIGLLLASGNTKKEAANKINRSEKTICRHADNLYKKTGSRNLSDITRFMISRYSNLNTEALLFKILQDVLALAVVGMATWFFSQPHILEMVQASLHSIINSK